MRIIKLSTFIFFILLAGTYLTASAQFGQPETKTKKDEFKMQKRLYLGGGLGFGISSYSTNIMIAPVLAYRLTPDIDVGTRFNYNYYRYNDDFVKFSTNNYGIGFFSRYYLFFFNDLFIHAEYEALNYDRVVDITTNNEVIKERDWVSSLFLGGGYRQWVGGNTFVGMSVLFNLLDTYESPYANPIFRIGVGVGL